jgi:copper chaperone
MMTYEMTVSGMSCGHCVGAVEGALKKIEGVVGVQVSMESGSVTVETNADVAAETLLTAVREAGYGAEVGS